MKIEKGMRTICQKVLLPAVKEPISTLPRKFGFVTKKYIVYYSLMKILEAMKERRRSRLSLDSGMVVVIFIRWVATCNESDLWAAH